MVEAVPAVHIFYATGWQKPILQYRATLPNQQLPQVNCPLANPNQPNPPLAITSSHYLLLQSHLAIIYGG